MYVFSGDKLIYITGGGIVSRIDRRIVLINLDKCVARNINTFKFGHSRSSFAKIKYLLCQCKFSHLELNSNVDNNVGKTAGDIITN